MWQACSSMSDARISTLVAISSSRWSPLSWKPGAAAKAVLAICARMALSRFTAPP
jgi:hypothetical protein